ncbi:MAG: type II secretion system protein [Patescibacteria group bacterium]
MKYRNKKNGFTIVELLVALSVFVAVLGLVTGGFMQSIRTQRSVAAMIAVNNNMSLVLEQIAREIRAGRNFCHTVDPNALPHPTCTTRFPAIGDDNIEFQRMRGNELVTVAYRYNIASTSIERKEGGGEFKAITAPNVNVQHFDFSMQDQRAPAFELPWRVTIRMTVSPINITSPTMVENIQTTVSARFLPFEAEAGSN